MTVRVLSHRECSPESVVLEHLVLTAAGDELSSPDFLSAWDYSIPISLRAEVTVDLARCLSETGLSRDAVLGLNLIWHATGSGLRGASVHVEARDGLNTVSIDLDGSELGGTLVIQVVMTLRGAGPRSEDLAPARPGSLLWSTERRTRLEGDGSRFPISHVSFEEAGLVGGLRAAWALLFESSDLYDSGLGNLRLYLNTDHPGVAELVDGGDQPGLLADVLHADVNRQMVLQALQTDDLDLTADYPTESLGELLAMSVRRNFPDRALDEIRALARTAPGEFEGYLQARGGFLL